MHDLSAFQRDCLYAIGGLDRPQGTDVKEALDDYYSTDINHARLYPNLDALVEEGLVEKGQKDRRTNAYALTDRGWELLAARRAWEDDQVAEAFVDPPVA